MSHSYRDHQAAEERSFTTFTVVWNTVLPALAVALLLDAPMGLAFAVAAAATIAIAAAFAPLRQR
jgi:hypothetical protein